jgi:hypothetical protein|tara:strand:- start:1287 stop:1505 length:219 start_codon:yes stop_codon:yes gene_type:complete
MSAPKIPTVPTPPPMAAPIVNEAAYAEEKVAKVETAVDSAKDVAKKAKKSGTTALQTSSGLNIPTVSGLNIT